MDTNAKADTFEEDYKKFINEETRPKVKHLFKISFKNMVKNYPDVFTRLRAKTGFKVIEGNEEEAKEILKDYYIPPYKFKIYTSQYVNKAGEIKEYTTFKVAQKKNQIFDELEAEGFVKEISLKGIRNMHKAKEIFNKIQDEQIEKYLNLTMKQILNFVNRRF